MRLRFEDHDRGSAGMTYVYPVVSRRARGVSVGVNLCPNNACNWRCVYCQVPGLVYGTAPEIDMARLESELDRMLDALVNGDYMERHVPEGARRINDVAFSGNGESTTSEQFAEAVEVVARCLDRVGLQGETKVVLITNGSMMQKPWTQAGIERMAAMNGEVWFKLDSAVPETRARLNGDRTGNDKLARNLRACATRCRTWLQTIALAWKGEPPSSAEQDAWLAFVGEQLEAGVPLAGVLLYGLARPSHQPEAPELSQLPAEWLEAYAERMRALGLEVQVSP